MSYQIPPPGLSLTLLSVRGLGVTLQGIGALETNPLASLPGSVADILDVAPSHDEMVSRLHKELQQCEDTIQKTVYITDDGGNVQQVQLTSSVILRISSDSHISP